MSMASRSLRVPRVIPGETVISAAPRRVFSNAHAYHINSICLNSDGESYISADDLRVNLWNLEISDQSFNIIDMKPPNMEELTEVITAAEFHPQHCNVFMYSSSKGCIRMVDMRDSALCDKPAKVFEEEEDPSAKSFFSEIISSISDIKFSADGRFILARDFMTLKVWDVNMEARPLKTIHIHEQLRPKLCDLYENDCIFDKFECAFSPDGNNVLTGSYHNMFHVYDRWGRSDTAVEASKNPARKKVATGLQRVRVCLFEFWVRTVLIAMLTSGRAPARAVATQEHGRGPDGLCEEGAAPRVAPDTERDRGGGAQQPLPVQRVDKRRHSARLISFCAAAAAHRGKPQRKTGGDGGGGVVSVCVRVCVCVA
jgi:hypothetical protein